MSSRPSTRGWTRTGREAQAPASEGSQDPTAIRCSSVGKSYGGNRAVEGADLSIRTGTVHALVGENGAGKSTLLGMISGKVTPDSGSVTVFGQELPGGVPRAARRLGLVAVYQELTMVPALSAEANVFLGQTLSTGGVLSRRAMRERYLEICRDLDVHIDPGAQARELSVSQQQILEIMRGVQAQGRILMLDEPSAALAEHERDILYRLLDRLRAAGTTIVFVSHNLEEVLRLSDTITVLRDGSVVTTADREHWDKQSLIRAMVGRDVEVAVAHGASAPGEVAMEATSVRLPGVLHDISVTVRRGEIVGLWGLVGSGRTTFMRSLCGLEPSSSGTMTLAGEAVEWPSSARRALAHGLAMVPESRKTGMVLGMNGSDNFWLGRKAPRRLWLDRRREARDAGRYASYFGFAPARLPDPVEHLSGGNQQKVLLAKWAGREPRVFLVDEPTRGIDIGAKSEVLASLVRLAEDGASIIVTSSELEEVLAISDRLLVFAGGAVVREITAGSSEFTVEDVVRMGFHEEEESS